MIPSVLPDNMLLIAFLAGPAGGLAMNLYMRLLTRRHVVPTDMVTLLGGIFTQSSDRRAQWTGTIVHLTLGFLFGLGYVWVLYAFNELKLPGVIPVGLGLGFAHGVVASFALMYSVLHGHPMQKYRTSGVTYAVGFTYISGHMVYGLSVALIAGILATAL